MTQNVTIVKIENIKTNEPWKRVSNTKIYVHQVFHNKINEIINAKEVQKYVKLQKPSTTVWRPTIAK